MSIIDLSDFKNRKEEEEEKQEGEPWYLISFDEEIPDRDIASLVGVLRDSAEVFMIVDAENMRGVKLSVRQAKVLGLELLKLSTIADLVYNDEDGLLDKLMAPEEVE